MLHRGSTNMNASGSNHVKFCNAMSTANQILKWTNYFLQITEHAECNCIYTSTATQKKIEKKYFDLTWLLHCESV